MGGESLPVDWPRLAEQVSAEVRKPVAPRLGRWRTIRILVPLAAAATIALALFWPSRPTATSRSLVSVDFPGRNVADAAQPAVSEVSHYRVGAGPAATDRQVAVSFARQPAARGDSELLQVRFYSADQGAPDSCETSVRIGAPLGAM
jgi:hypothetical protein